MNNLLEMALFFNGNAMFDFVSNVLENVSSLKEGRLFLIKQKMLKRGVKMLQGERTHRKRHFVGTIRNCAFECEEHPEAFSEVVGPIAEAVKQECTSEESKGEDGGFLKQLVETLVLLANAEQLLKEMHSHGIQDLLSKVDAGADEELKSKILVVINQLATV